MLVCAVAEYITSQPNESLWHALRKASIVVRAASDLTHMAFVHR